MTFSWDGEFVLRRVVETDSVNHRVYKHSKDAADISDTDNFFNSSARLASQARFVAIRVNPKTQWNVELENADPRIVAMAAFQLKLKVSP